MREGRSKGLNDLEGIRRAVFAEHKGLTALHLVTTAIARSLSLDTILDIAVTKVVEVLGLGACHIWLLDPGTDQLVLRAHRGRSEEFVRSQSVISWEQVPLAQEATEAGRSVVVADTAALAADQLQFARREGFRWVAVFFLREKGSLVGTVEALTKAPEGFAPETLAILAEVADQLTIAVQNAFLFEAAERRGDELATLIALIQRLARPLHERDIYESVARAGRDLLRAKMSRVWLLDEAGEWLRLVASVGDRGRHRVGVKQVPVAGSLMGQIVQSRQPRAVPDVLSESSFHNKAWADQAGVHAYAGFPLIIGNQVVGILSVFRAEVSAFSQGDLDLLSTLAVQMAGAIETARLHAAVQLQADDLEKKVQERTAELDRASRIKSQFLANMSHELRTPLNAIIGFAEVLQDETFGGLNDRQHRYVRNIHNSGQHLFQLINDILDLSRVEEGRLMVIPQVIELEPDLHEACAVVRRAAEQKGITLTLEIEPACRTVAADPTRLRQIVLNLLSNAVKFTPDGGRISVRVKRSGEEVQIAVADSGIGIKPEDQELLFKPFSQLDASEARRFAGTGLGLALTKRLVELQGGGIAVESPGAGQGSVFTVFLPTKLPSREMVLMIDDERSVVESVQEVLVRAGYRLTFTHSGEEGITLAVETAPDLIILNLTMPGLDGFEVLKRLRAYPATARVPILILSGATEADAQAAIQLGADDFLAKPVSPRMLVSAVRSLVGRRLNG